jgi:hypothetical protein
MKTASASANMLLKLTCETSRSLSYVVPNEIRQGQFIIRDVALLKDMGFVVSLSDADQAKMGAADMRAKPPGGLQYWPYQCRRNTVLLITILSTPKRIPPHAVSEHLVT